MNRPPYPQSTLIAQTGTVTGGPVKLNGAGAVFQSTIDGTGAVTATVIVEGSMTTSHWANLGTMSLSGTGTDSKKFATTEPWPYVRTNITAISGTGATVGAFVATP